jgi:hypothetical protein
MGECGDQVVRLVPGGGLMAHEGVEGGHTLAKHVGKSPEFLRHRLATEPGLRAASTFYDRATAERAVGYVLTRNKRRLNAWLASPSRGIQLSARMSGTGFTLVPDSSETTEVTRVIVVLRRSSDFRDGFRVHTAWPAP